MSINKSESQIFFEGIFTGNCGIPFRQIPKNQYEQTVLTKQQAEVLGQLLEDEIESYYYKALLSYMESIPALERNLFSWATVRLYYSVFYAIKAYLACKHIAILRAERRLFYVKAKENEAFKKCEDTTDHKGTILTLCKLFKNSDVLLSNNINGINVYQWMMQKREEVNYRDMNFHDPAPPAFWATICNDIKLQGIKSVVEKLVNDEWLYCFQDEYAVLGIPTKRIMLTVDEIHRLGRTSSITLEKQELINTLSSSLDEGIVKVFEIWK